MQVQKKKKQFMMVLAKVIKIFDLETDGCRVITNFGKMEDKKFLTYTFIY